VTTAYRKFETGADRDLADDKPQYAAIFPPELMRAYAQYILAKARRNDGSIRSCSNWQKGIPVDSYIDSLMRHLTDLRLVLRGFKVTERNGHEMTEKELACAMVFNANGLLFEILCAIGEAKHEENTPPKSPATTNHAAIVDAARSVQ
jgi:hypothetical protein